MESGGDDECLDKPSRADVSETRNPHMNGLINMFGKGEEIKCNTNVFLLFN